MKLTKAQRIRLQLIQRGADRSPTGVASRSDAGYPVWLMEARLMRLGLIEIIDSHHGLWPVHPAAGYRILPAGLSALAEQEKAG